MSQICGLFSRRAYNLEAILCLPLQKDGNFSGIRLWLNESSRIDQIIAEMEKLVDVTTFYRLSDADKTSPSTLLKQLQITRGQSTEVRS